MPKAKEFDIKNYSDFEIKELYQKLFRYKTEDFGETIEIAGIKLTKKYFYVSFNWGLELSEKEIKNLKKDKEFIEFIKTDFEKEKEKKIKEYEKLKAKLDYCLEDVKIYQKLCLDLNEMNYCIAIDALKNIERLYLKGTAVSKAKYRSKQAEYSKIECK